MARKEVEGVGLLGGLDEDQISVATISAWSTPPYCKSPV